MSFVGQAKHTTAPLTILSLPARTVPHNEVAANASLYRTLVCIRTGLLID